MHEFTEGGARFFAEAREVASADMEVFYNPLMRENRDLSLLVLSWLFATRSPRLLIFPMAASGARPLRMLEELDVPVCDVAINDRDAQAIASVRVSLERNERASAWGGRIAFSTMSAQALLASAKPADYVEIDPYGSPLPFLDPAVRCIAHRGILAVTATDTAALCGTYPKTGLRKYHAFTKRSPLMHEHAARILAQVVERCAAQHGRHARIVFAYTHLHYIKLFFEIRDSKTDAHRLIERSEYWMIDRTGFTLERRTLAEGYREGMIGPLSAEPLYDRALLDHMATSKARISSSLEGALALIREESTIEGSAIDLHLLASELSLPSVPKTAQVLDRLGPHRASRTHFCETAIRTSASRDEVCEAMR